MNIDEIIKEQQAMKKSFPSPIIKAAWDIFGKEKMLWNHANGAKIAQIIKDTCRVFEFGESKMIYDITAPMQMGKSTATLSMIVRLMTLNIDKDFIICYYLCSANKSVVQQFSNEATKFFENLNYFDVSSTDEYLSVTHHEQTAKIMFVHNTSKKALKKRAIEYLKVIDDVETIKMLLFDEADQALGKDSKRHQFVQQILGVENVYDSTALTIRQGKQLIECWIGATNFFPYYKGSSDLDEIYSRFDLVEHPNYYGLLRIMENGFLFEKEEHDVGNVIEKFCNSNTEFDQWSRPVCFVRIRNGNKQSKNFYEDNISSNVDRKCAFTTDYNEFCRLKSDEETEVITVHFNGSSAFSHGNLQTLLEELSSNTRMSKKQNFNFKKLGKKIVIIFCGTLKEGNSILNKNSKNISFLWENITLTTKKYENPLQQAGRICKIGTDDPPLLFTSKAVINVLVEFVNKRILPDGDRVRWAKSKRKSSFHDVQNVFFMKRCGFETHVAARDDANREATKLGIKANARYGRFKKSDHQEVYRKKIYPAVDYWHGDNFVDKDQLSVIRSQGKKHDGGVFYVEEVTPGNFAYCLVHLLSEEDEFIENYAEINSNECSLMRYVPPGAESNILENKTKQSMLTVA
jgi:hypothetical protein